VTTKRPPYRPPPVFTPFLRRFTDERARDLADTIALYNRVRAMHCASLWSKPGTADAVAHLVLDRVAETIALPAAPTILDAIAQSLLRLIELETTIFSSPDIDWNDAVLSLKEQVDLRRFLRAQEHFLSHEDRVGHQFVTTLESIMGNIILAMPSLPQHASASIFTVPLIALVSNPGEIVDGIIAAVIDNDVQEAGLFTAVTRRIYESVCAVSGLVPDEEHRKPFLTADKSELPGPELVAAYLGGTPFAAIFNTPIPFSIPRKTFASHGIILAPPNHGKTQLLGALCHGFLEEEDPPGLFVLDPHGDLLRKLERLDVFQPEYGRLRDRIVVIDPEDPGGPPSLNFLDLGTQHLDAAAYETFTYLMSSLSSVLTTKQGTAVAYILMLLRAIPGSTIDTLRQIMEEKSKTLDRSKYASIVRTLDPLVQDFFDNQFFNPQMSETRQQINRRLYTVLANDTFRRMFSAPRNAFDAYEAMQQKKIVLINGARNALRAEGSGVFLRFMVAQFLSAAFRRASIPEDQRHLCMLVIDEAHHIFDDQTEAILTECRKFGLGFLAATQLVEQMEQSVKAAVYGATAIKIAGPVSYADAQALGREMYCSGEFIRSMKAIERQHADFAVHVRGMTDQAIRLTIPYGVLENAPRMDDAALARMRDLNRGKMSAPAAASPTTAAILEPQPEPDPPITPKKW
jgi:hypothetical protein